MNTKLIHMFVVVCIIYIECAIVHIVLKVFSEILLDAQNYFR